MLQSPRPQPGALWAPVHPRGCHVLGLVARAACKERAQLTQQPACLAVVDCLLEGGHDWAVSQGLTGDTCFCQDNRGQPAEVQRAAVYQEKHGAQNVSRCVCG